MKFWCGTAFMSTLELPAVARMLDETGYHGFLVPDHLIYPHQLSSPYPSPSGRPFWAPETAWPDSWVLIGALAAVTTNLHFSNSVYIAPARPILEVAKQVATAAVLSGGRVSLAVGAGWMREEFRTPRPGLHQPRRSARRDGPGATSPLARRLGVLAGDLLRDTRVDD